MEIPLALPLFLYSKLTNIQYFIVFLPYEILEIHIISVWNYLWDYYLVKKQNVRFGHFETNSF